MIHLWWHERSVPENVERNVWRWKATNPGTAVRVWGPGDYPDLVAQVHESASDVVEVDLVRHVANVCRWQLLYDYGGMWADADVTPLRRFVPFVDRTHPWSAGLGVVPTPFVCGGAARDPLWRRMVDESLDHPSGISPEASGGRLLGRVAWPDELDLVPAGLFAAVDAAGNDLPLPSEGRYSTHDWATSRQRRAAGDRRS